MFYFAFAKCWHRAPETCLLQQFELPTLESYPFQNLSDMGLLRPIGILKVSFIKTSLILFKRSRLSELLSVLEMERCGPEPETCCAPLCSWLLCNRHSWCRSLCSASRKMEQPGKLHKVASLMNDLVTDEVSMKFMIVFWKSSPVRFIVGMSWPKDNCSLYKLVFDWLRHDLIQCSAINAIKRFVFEDLINSIQKLWKCSQQHFL